MATIIQPLALLSAVLPATNYPLITGITGTNFPFAALVFDQSTDKTCYFFFESTAYASGNVTARIKWEAASGTSGDVIWAGQLACITANTDTQDIETKAFATATTVTDSHLGTTAKRLHEITLTLSNLDSIAAGDWVVLKFYRDADAAGDTLAADARLIALQVEYSDV